MKVRDLVPGDRVNAQYARVTFIAATEHPLWPHLRLVVWKTDDGRALMDALDADQELHDRIGVIESTDEEREARLRAALLGPAGQTEVQE